MSEQLRVGVIGVGNMGKHHARVYRDLPDADLVGVCDADTDKAQSVAAEYQTTVWSQSELLSAVDAVSIVVPTDYHVEVATAAFEEGVDTIIEKPLAGTVQEANEIRGRAAQSDSIVQVGHIERFNPAIRALRKVLDTEDEQPLAVTARRQGPPVDRQGSDSVVMDLMVHDIDLLLWLAASDISGLAATSTAGGQYVDTTVQFENGIVGSLRGSRISQQRVRELTVTAPECQINVDYLDQSIQIYRHSTPEYVTNDGDVRYRNESVIEQPIVDNGEPLRAELEAFLGTVRSRDVPPVTIEDGVRAVEVAEWIEADSSDRVSTVSPDLTI